MSEKQNQPKPWALGETFAHLTEDGGVMPVPNGPDFWTSGVAALPPGRLISLMRSEGNWSSWEMHPNGDEWIYQLSGQMTLILDREDSTQEVPLPTGRFAIVPKGIWHTANVIEPGEALFITLGDGTQHRDR